MYDQVTQFVKNAGERLREKAGNIPDIGVRKAYLTEEDLRIEREFSELIKTFGADHTLYAEEEHDFFETSDNVWVMDPISGTSVFIRGLPHYGIVVAHIQKGETKFALVYDPSMRDVYSAEKGAGAFLNSKRQFVAQTNTQRPRILLHVASSAWDQAEMNIRLIKALRECTVTILPFSSSLEYVYIASGKFDGSIAFTKDTFVDFAGSLLVREAGGVCTNREGSSDIKPTDRVFVASHPSIHSRLLEITQRELKNIGK